MSLLRGADCKAQDLTPYNVVEKAGLYFDMVVEGEDTLYYDCQKPAKVVGKLPKQNDRDWKKYYHLFWEYPKKPEIPEKYR